MNRKALLLGFFATSSQVLLLRELVASLNGNELFIATAFFGWLAAVGLGAYAGGGRRLRFGPEPLFYAAAVLLTVTLIGVRLMPAVLTDITGETIPFTIAVMVSVVAMFPVGLVCGWLFPAITREGAEAAASVVVVYLWEGIGAFIGGLVVLFSVGIIFSSLGLSIAIGLVVTLMLLYPPAGRGTKAVAGGIALALVLFIYLLFFVPRTETAIDNVRYRPFNVLASFDTHYGRQAVVWRDSILTLVTDNSIEAVYLDLAAAEDALIPALVYDTAAKRMLYIGRAEFGAAQLADSLRMASISAVDSRAELGSVLNALLPVPDQLYRYDRDPVRYFGTLSGVSPFHDIVVINPGAADNYRTSRLLTTEFLSGIRKGMPAGGVLVVRTSYDTDRYITEDEQPLLKAVYGTLKSAFPFVEIWPGNSTLFFASDSSYFDISLDSILARVDRLSYRPQYVNESYLFDRLSEFKKDRLDEVVSVAGVTNSLNRPVLPHLQMIYNAGTHPADRALLDFVLKKPQLTIGIGVLIGLFWLWSVWPRGGTERFGLFLYFTAGAVSLSLEVVSFYVFQSTAGLLYSQMAVLIGVFMLGLAVGAYYTEKRCRTAGGRGALVALIGLTVVFLFTYDCYLLSARLEYHVLFLLGTAVATGSLFTTATRRYYVGETLVNRGIGYGVELAGSALGALIATPLLLPVIGIEWLLIAIAVLPAAALVGTILTRRR